MPINLDLMGALKSVNNENGIGPFQLEKNGKNYPKFNMIIRRLQYSPKTPEPRAEKVGTWIGGFGEKDSVRFDNGKDLQNHLAHTVFRIVTFVVSHSVVRSNFMSPSLCIGIATAVRDENRKLLE